MGGKRSKVAGMKNKISNPPSTAKSRPALTHSKTRSIKPVAKRPVQSAKAAPAVVEVDLPVAAPPIEPQTAGQSIAAAIEKSAEDLAAVVNLAGPELPASLDGQDTEFEPPAEEI